MRGGMRNPMPEQPADVRNKNFEEVFIKAYSILDI